MAIASLVETVGREGGELAPDWAAIDREIRCPLCGYNLRGLTEARCPECGARHLWRDLCDPRRRSHPYLFEHHPKRNVWSLYRTFLGGVWPAKFWSTLHPMQTIARRRLALYAFVVLAVAYCMYAFSILGFAVGQYLTLVHWNVQPRTWTQIFSSTYRRLGILQWNWVFLLPVIWTLLSALSLFIFIPSMRRARLRVIHAVRVIVYASDVLILLWIANAALQWLAQVLVLIGDLLDVNLGPASLVWLVIAFLWLYKREFSADLDWERSLRAATSVVALLVFVALAYVLETVVNDRPVRLSKIGAGPVCLPLMVLAGWVFAKRLSAACRLYLGLERGRTIVVLSQVVTLLAVLCGISVYEVYRRGGFN